MAGRISFFHRGLVVALSTLLSVQPAFMEAAWGQQIIIDPNGNVGMTRMQTGRSAPVVDIARPNSGGVSHNRYQRFNTPTGGVVLNNSASDSDTAVAGRIGGNTNLSSGTATTIVNEVTSTETSTLNGRLEVAGDRANVVVANPNGVTCDGCGFVNTDAATLTTGVPIISGGNVSLDVATGQVRIGRGGLDGAATGVSAVNLIGRTVVIDGKVTAVDQINVQGGSQRYDLSGQKQAAPLTASSAAGSDYAIDGTAFGAMEAGRIQVVGNESGLGVRLRGALRANNRDVIISGPSQVDVTSASASRIVRVTSTRGSVSIERDITAESGDATIVANENLTLDDRAGIYGATAVTLVSTRGRLKTNSDLQSGGNMRLQGRALEFGAYANATGDINFIVSHEAVIEGATLVAQSIDGTRFGRVVTVSDSAFFSAQDMPITTQELRFGKNVVIDGLSDVTSSKLIAQVSGDFRNGADLRQHSTAEITWGGNLYNEIGGILSYGAATTLTRTTAVHNSGIITADDSITIDVAGFFNNRSGAVLSKSVRITSSGELVNLGNISSEGELRLTAATNLRNDGFVQAARSWWSGNTVSNQGNADLRISGTLQMTAATLLANKGSINVLGTATLIADHFANDGMMIVEGELAAVAPTITNAGSLVSATKMWLKGASEILNQGTLASYDQIILDASVGVINRGDLIADRDLLVRAPSFTNATADALVRSGTGRILSASIVNHGKIFSINTFQRNGDIDLFENHGTFATKGSINIIGRNDQSRIILALGSNMIAGLQPDDAEQSLLNTSSVTLNAATLDIQGAKTGKKFLRGQVTAGRSIVLTTTKGLELAGGLNAKGGDVTLNASHVVVAATGAINATGIGRINSAAGFVNDGSAVFGRYLELGENVAWLHNSGVISASWISTHAMSGGFKNSGLFSTDGSAKIVANTIENTGHIQSGSWSVLEAATRLSLRGTTASQGATTLRGNVVILETALADQPNLLSASNLIVEANQFLNYGTVSLTGDAVSTFNLGDVFRNEGVIAASGAIDVIASQFGLTGKVLDNGEATRSLISSEKDVTLRGKSETDLATMVLNGSIVGNNVRVRNASDLSLGGTGFVSSAGDIVMTAAGAITLRGEVAGRNLVQLTAAKLSLQGNIYGGAVRGISDGLIDHTGTSYGSQSLAFTTGTVLVNSGNINSAGTITLAATDLIRNREGGRIEATNLTMKDAASLENFGTLFGGEKLRLRGGRLINNDGAMMRAGTVDMVLTETANNIGTIHAYGILGSIGTSFTNSGLVRADEVVTLTTVSQGVNNSGRIFGKVIAVASGGAMLNTGQIGSIASTTYENATDVRLSAAKWMTNEGVIRGGNIGLESNGFTNKETYSALATNILNVDAGTGSLNNIGVLQGNETVLMAAGWVENSGRITGTKSVGISAQNGRILNSKVINGEEITLIAENNYVKSETSIAAGKLLSVKARWSSFDGRVSAADELRIQSTAGGIELGELAISNKVQLIATGVIKAGFGAIRGTNLIEVSAGDIVNTGTTATNQKLRVFPTSVNSLFVRLENGSFGPQADTDKDAAATLAPAHYEQANLTATGVVEISAAGNMLISGKIDSGLRLVLQADKLLGLRNANLSSDTRITLQGNQYLKNYGNIKLLAPNLNLKQNWGWFYTSDWLTSDRIDYNLTVGARTIVVNSDHRFVDRSVTFMAIDDIVQTDQVISARGITYNAGRDIKIDFDPFKWRQNNFGGGYLYTPEKIRKTGSSFWVTEPNPEYVSRQNLINKAISDNPGYWEAVRAGLRGQTLLAQGGGISLAAGQDILLTSGRINTSGELTLQAARNIKILPLYVNTHQGMNLENVGWQFSDKFRLRGDWTPANQEDYDLTFLNSASRKAILDPYGLKSWESPYRMSESGQIYEPDNPADVKELRAYVTQLTADKKIQISAGNRLDIVGAAITSNFESIGQDNSITIEAGNGIFIAAANGNRTFSGRWQWTDSNFASKEEHDQRVYQFDDILTASTFTAANGSIKIYTNGVLNSAGAEITAKANLIVETKTGNLTLGTYRERWVRGTTMKKDGSWLGGSGSHELELSAIMNTGNTLIAPRNVTISSGADLTIISGKIKSNRVFLKAAGNLNILAAINEFRRTEFSEYDNRVTITTINSGQDLQTASMTSIETKTPKDFSVSVGGKITIGGDKGETLNELILKSMKTGVLDVRLLTAYKANETGAADPIADDVSKTYDYKLPTGAEYRYLQTLINDNDATYETITLRNQVWYDKQVRLNPAFQALMSVAISSVTGGLGFGTGLMAGAQKAALNSVLNNVAGAMITGNFDPGQVLRSALTAGASSYISGALMDGFGINTGKDYSLKNLGVADYFSPGQITNRLGEKIISHGVDNVLAGQSPFEGLDSLGRSFLVSETMTIAHFGIGELGKNDTNWEGSIPHMLLHGGAGCVAMAAAGGPCTSGLFAGVTQSVLSGSELSDEQKAALVPVAGAFAGYLSSGDDAIGVSFASQVANSGFINNYLFHKEAEMKAELLDKQARCFREENCSDAELASISAQLTVIEQLDRARESALNKACYTRPSSPECSAEKQRLYLAFKSYPKPNGGLFKNGGIVGSEYIEISSLYGTYRMSDMQAAAVEALLEIPVDTLTGVIDVAAIAAKASLGDEASRLQLAAMGKALKLIAADPVNAISEQVKSDLARADALEAQGKIHEANVIRSKVFIEAELTVFGGASIVAGGLRFVSRAGKVYDIEPDIDAGRKTIDGVWDQSRYSPIQRGIAIENLLASTEYRDWYRIGAERNGYSPDWDFNKDSVWVSVKTMDTNGQSWGYDMRNHIDELQKWVPENPGTTKVLDIRVQPGGTSDAHSLIDYGASRGVQVRIDEF